MSQPNQRNRLSLLLNSLGFDLGSPCSKIEEVVIHDTGPIEKLPGSIAPLVSTEVERNTEEKRSTDHQSRDGIRVEPPKAEDPSDSESGYSSDEKTSTGATSWATTPGNDDCADVLTAEISPLDNSLWDIIPDGIEPADFMAHIPNSSWEACPSPLLKECAVCHEDISIALFTPASKQCLHDPSVCSPCLKSWINSLSPWMDFQCPACFKNLNPDEIDALATPEASNRYRVHKMFELLGTMDIFIWCTRCESGQFHHSKYPIMTCHNCSAKTCTRHKVPWHHGLTCKQYDHRQKHPTRWRLFGWAFSRISQAEICPEELLLSAQRQFSNSQQARNRPSRNASLTSRQHLEEQRRGRRLANLFRRREIMEIEEVSRRQLDEQQASERYIRKFCLKCSNKDCKMVFEHCGEDKRIVKCPKCGFSKVDLEGK